MMVSKKEVVSMKDTEGSSFTDKVVCLPGNLACAGTTTSGFGVGASVGGGAVGVGVTAHSVTGNVGSNSFGAVWRKETAAEEEEEEEEAGSNKEVRHNVYEKIHHHHLFSSFQNIL